jgi:holo-[acyl-carrier protein] synthase
MIAGIGIDLVRIERIKKTIEKWGDSFLNRVFTKNEQDYSYSHILPYQHLAGRFGAKEAFLKAIGTGWGGGIRWTDIEVMRNEDGSPKIKVYGIPDNFLSKMGVKDILVSISHERDYAIAQVILVSDRGK